MKGFRHLTVRQAAAASGVSVRALHHYDEIGLLSPGRSAAGYRLYGEADLLRLQQILIGRALGMPLEQIRRALDDPAFDLAAALRRQRAELAAQAERTAAMVASIDVALRRLECPDRPHTPDQQATQETAMDPKTLFDGFDPAAHDAEAQGRWGETDAFKESRRRTGAYGAEQWRVIRAEEAAIWRDAAAAMTAGQAADSPAALALAERHRVHVDRWFYPLSRPMHAALADLWEADERFAASIDAHGAGLTGWIAAAVRTAAA